MSDEKPEIVIEPDQAALAAVFARRLLEEVATAQSSGRVPSLVLTGGSIADEAHREIAAQTSGYDVDWSNVELWWGDERFVPQRDPERNAGQARAAFLDPLGIGVARVHEMPASDDGLDLDAAAASYAEELARAGDGDSAPAFDLLILGMGPDGHIASLFPGRPELDESERTAVAITGSPKPPPERITLTYPVLNRARTVWFIVAGSQKAEAVRRALAGDAVAHTPAAGVRGTHSTVFWLDEGAAGSLSTS